ncbi:phage baseplate plug family protein [Brucella inopinata]|uniref:phage baseplate plug family protein n=1 Tax=Brucella inopinata TaxID=1218315 RepID=UPI000870DAF6|nr:hypothetical protein [Brucella inopinata]SCD25497.1 hypothetical protein BR141012304_21038 [Brucella inopinata]
MDIYKIPLLSGTMQSLQVMFGSTEYRLTLRYRDVDDGLGLWSLDIADTVTNTDIICGVPLVTGADLLAQYRYLGIAGSLFAYTDGEPDAVPTFDSLGADSNLYFVVQ